jgi:integrase
VERPLPKVKLLSGERHRERVSVREEHLYFKGASSDAMDSYADSFLLRDVTTILLDCGLRPEECFRLRTENVAEGKLEVYFGKTENARRRVPMTPRVKAILEMRLSKSNGSTWVFPATTKSGHIESSSLKKQHGKAVEEATRIMREETGRSDQGLEPFELYTLRHTCLTRWAPHMDPWTLAYLAGHRDMNITKRYVHPQEETVRLAMDRARGDLSGHTSGHTVKRPQTDPGEAASVLN